MFEALSRYRGLSEGPKRFQEVRREDVEEAERALGFAFPFELRRFYAEIGYGWLGTEVDPTLRNLFAHPLDIVDLMTGVSEFAPPEGFLPGDLPFFDAGAGRFLVMRPQSDTPSAVFRDTGAERPIAPNLLQFVNDLELDAGFFLRKP